MSFDVFLRAFRQGVKANADKVAARAVLERFAYEHTPGSGAYYVSFEDGSGVELYSGGLCDDVEAFDGGMFAMRGLSESIADFIYAFSRAAGCTMCPAMEGRIVLLPRDDMAADLPADISREFRLIPIGSGAELLTVLSGGYEAWRAYRDHVVRTTTHQAPPPD